MNKLNPITYDLSNYGVCLPNGYNLDDDEMITSVIFSKKLWI